MAATAAQIERLRRMVQADETAYSDEALALVIESYPLTDERGTDPFYWNTGVTPPVRVATVGWIETYDLHAAAAEIWEEKAAEAAQDYDFQADGGSYSRSQVHEQFQERVRYHLSRRAPGSQKIVLSPTPPDPAVWLGNLAELDP